MRVAAHQVDLDDHGSAWIVAVVAVDNEDDPATFAREEYARGIAERVNDALATTRERSS